MSEGARKPLRTLGARPLDRTSTMKASRSILTAYHGMRCAERTSHAQVGHRHQLVLRSDRFRFSCARRVAPRHDWIDSFELIQTLGDMYTSWLVWVPIIAVIAGQAILLFLSVDTSQKN